MVSVKLDDTLYLKPNLTLKLDDKFIVIFNDGIEVKRKEYADVAAATSKFNGIVTALGALNTFFLNLDTLL